MDTVKPGYKTTEFLATTAGMFIVTLLALLTSFGMVHVTPEQQGRILDFAGVAWVALPAAYTAGRSIVKAKAAGS
jgi:hypothetical protein